MSNPNLVFLGHDYATRNANPGVRVYGERLKKYNGNEMRLWDPYRSKLAAALKHGLKTNPFEEDSSILYLGGGNGTTISHISDITPRGLIFAVEFSPRSMTDLYLLSETRKNIAPILGDAHRPQDYVSKVPAQVDILYQDVAQRDQVDIFAQNAEQFLKQDGMGFLMVKARSIDVTKEPAFVFGLIENSLFAHNFEILEKIRLDPEEKDHCCFVVRKKPL